MAGLAAFHHRQGGVALLAVGRRSDCLMVEACSFALMASLAVVVLARQSTGMTIRTGQAGTGNTNHIVVLGFGGTGTAGSIPERIVMAGRAGLRHQGVMAINTVVDRAVAEHHVMVLSHRRVAACSSPEISIVAELAAVGCRDICGRAMTEATVEV